MGSTRHRRRHSHKLIAALVAVVIVAGLGGAAELGYASLKGRAAQLQANLTAYLQAGQGELEAGKTSLKLANTNHDVSLVAEALGHFDAANRQFIAARQLADSSRLLQALEIAPAIGDLARSRHKAVDGIAEMGAAISSAGHELATLDGELIKPAPTGPAGRTLLSALGQTHASLAKVRADLARAQKAAAGVDAQVVPSGQQATFLKARETISSALAGMDEFELLYPVLTEVLGGNGPRTYLIEQVNPAELRPGGGFMGTYSVVRADAGVLKVIRSGDAYELADPRPLPGQPGFIAQPNPVRDIIPWVSWSFVDSNIFPDFPSSAKAAERFVQPRLGTRIDAVVSMDYYTVARMLELTGPLAVPGYGRTVTSGNLISQLIQLDLLGDPAHKAILGAIAGPLMARVSGLPPDRWPALIGVLNGLASGRHLQAYFNNASVEKEIERIGWSGALNPVSVQDHIMEVENNIGGGKANYFLVRNYTVVLTRNGSKLHHKVTVDLLNTQPYSSRYVVYYRVYVSLYVSDSVSSASRNLIPAKYPNPAPPTGTKLLEGWLPNVSCCGGRGHAVFEYDTPWSVDKNGMAEIYWQKQPGTFSDRIDVSWNNGQGHTFKAVSDLGVDRLITLALTGVTVTAGHPAQATLPSLSLG